MDSRPKIISNGKPINGLIVLEPVIFRDFRGENFETFSHKTYQTIFSSIQEWRDNKEEFLIDSFSSSRRGVVRGFHGDHEAWKLVQVLKGEVEFRVIDMRPDSTTFKQEFQTLLGDKNRRQVLVPAGCVNAHQCLTDECLFSYKLTQGYVEPACQIHVNYKDSKTPWPIQPTITSVRDS